MQGCMVMQVPLYLSDGSTPPKDIDEDVEQVWNQILDKCSDFRDLPSWSTGMTDNISLEACMMQYWSERHTDPEAGTSLSGVRHSAHTQLAHASLAQYAAA